MYKRQAVRARDWLVWLVFGIMTGITQGFSFHPCPIILHRTLPKRNPSQNSLVYRPTSVCLLYTSLVAQFYGAGEKENLKCAVAKSYIMTALLSVIVLAVSEGAVNHVLLFLQTPDNVKMCIRDSFTTASASLQAFCREFR